MEELVGGVAFEVGDGEGEGVEGEGEVVGFVGEGAAEGVFDAIVLLVMAMVRHWDAHSRIVSLIIWLLHLSAFINIVHSWSSTSSFRSGGGS